jgi:hypothetical protein
VRAGSHGQSHPATMMSTSQPAHIIAPMYEDAQGAGPENASPTRWVSQPSGSEESPQEVGASFFSFSSDGVCKRKA